jgi:hypothetical protein
MVRNWKVRSTRFAQSSVAFCMFLVMFTAAPAVSMEILGRVPRILILYPYGERIAATTAAGEAVRTRLLQVTAGKIDIFSEFLDLSRFPEKTHIEQMARYLTDKYADRRPDVVIALGEVSANFIVTNRNTIAPAARIVVTGSAVSLLRNELAE